MSSGKTAGPGENPVRHGLKRLQAVVETTGDDACEKDQGQDGAAMIEKALVAVITGILLIALCMQLLLTAIPLFRRIEFDATCHVYARVMDHGGGLTAADLARLTADLEARGFSVESLSGNWEGQYGNELSLIVRVSFAMMQFSGNLTFKEVQRSLTYQTSLICRKMFDFDTVP